MGINEIPAEAYHAVNFLYSFIHYEVGIAN